MGAEAIAVLRFPAYGCALMCITIVGHVRSGQDRKAVNSPVGVAACTSLHIDGERVCEVHSVVIRAALPRG